MDDDQKIPDAQPAIEALIRETSPGHTSPPNRPIPPPPPTPPPVPPPLGPATTRVDNPKSNQTKCALATLVQRAEAYAAKADTVAEPGRNKAAFSLAGNLAAIDEQGTRLNESQIVALVLSWNQRNTPPLPDAEIVAAVASALKNGTPRETKPARPPESGSEPQAAESDEAMAVIDASEMCVSYPELKRPVINKLLRETETANIIAPPKAGKTYLALDLALAVATGRPWLGLYEVNGGPVLYIDAELHRSTLAKRIATVASARGIFHPDFAGELDILSLRGKLRDIIGMGDYFAGIPHGKYRLIVLDALYRLLPKDVDENSNADITRLYNAIDCYAEQTGAAFLIVHHASKGAQGNKAVTDVGAGAGAQSRAADTHFVLRSHEDDDAVVLEAAVRSWPPVKPICLRWTYPTWNFASDLDPTALKREGKPRRKSAEAESPAEATWSMSRFAGSFITPEARSRDAIITDAEEAGLSERKASRLLAAAVERGKVHKWDFGGKVATRYATIPQPLTATPEVSRKPRGRPKKIRASVSARTPIPPEMANRPLWAG